MFIEVYEEVDIKLTALNYIMTSNRDSKCTEDPDKSISKVNNLFLATENPEYYYPLENSSAAKFAIGNMSLTEWNVVVLGWIRKQLKSARIMSQRRI